MEVRVLDPFCFAFGKSAARDEQVNMGVELEITSKSMDDGHDGRRVAEFILGVNKNCLHGNLNQDVEPDFTIGLNDGPKEAWDGEDNMLIGDVEKTGFVFCNPVVGLDFAAT